MLHYLQNLFQALDFSSLADAVLRVAAVFLCLTVHETCHGLAALALGYLDFMLGGIHIRYVCDLTLALSVLSLFLILEQIHFDGTRSARILYTIVLFLLLVTIGRGFLTIFSNETNDILLRNPDFYLYVSRIFHS